MSDTISANVQGFTALVEQQAAAIQTAAAAATPGRALTFSPGSVLLAICQAVAGVGLWLQALGLNILVYGRATTASGADLDSWMAQFQFARISGQSASCSAVLLSRYATSQPVTVLTGGTVQTGDGSQQFAIIADATQTGYSAGAGGYVMASGVSSVQVTVQAVASGSAGNVAAGTITAFASGVVGADTVTNTGAATGGADAEVDVAFRTRFWGYLQYLYRATAQAVTYAIQTVQPGLSVTISDSYDTAGNFAPGTFFCTVDDGTGSPSAQLIAAAGAQAQATRALGIQASVLAPSTVTANVAASIALVSGYSGTVIGPVAQAAAATFVSSVTLGQNLSYFNLGSAIKNASPGVAEVVSLTINGSAADLTSTSRQKIVAGTIIVSIAG